jgi:hypothetical protein
VGIGGRSDANAASTLVTLQLTGAQEVPSVTSPGSATATITFDDITRALGYNLTVQGIPAEQVTAAHIHRGAVGVNGPVIYTLSATGFSSVSGVITLTAADAADLMAGNIYLNVHSYAYPNGFARAQIFLDPVAAIRAAAADILDAWNEKDAARFASHFTAKGLADVFDGATVDEVAMFIGEDPLVSITVSDIQVSGTTATSITDIVFPEGLDRVMHFWVLEGGAWKIDAEQDLLDPIPPGVTVVEMQMREYAFVYDKAAAAGGNVAFHVVNVGQQDHEALLLKLGNAQIADLLELGEDEDLPPGVEFMGANFAPPGEEFNLVFGRPLSPGRYGFVCFVPDNGDGPPHALLGMTSEFTVGAAAPTTPVVRPPSTGDAGLADPTGKSVSTWLLVVGSIALGAGILGLVASARRAAA